MAIYNDYDALLERFSIMTESPTANYTAAMQYCCNNTTPELADRLRNEVMQTQNAVIDNCKKTYNKFLQEGKDTKLETKHALRRIRTIIAGLEPSRTCNTATTRRF